jgi:molybdenum cofactor synthesis domain-containing protein
MMGENKPVTAAIVLIGDELLSGRTQDVNARAIALALAPLGIDLSEVRIVGDDLEAIAEAVNALRARNTYVFTTGGIGPTHDDITADGIGRAFGLAVDHHPEAVALLEHHYSQRAEALTEARKRMARMPKGASLIVNAATGAPGFRVENVFILAGVPSIMRAMLEAVLPHLEGGAVTGSVTVWGRNLREGDIASGLEALQSKAGGAISFGSYPHFNGPGDYGVNLVARSRNALLLDQACKDLMALMRSAGIEPEVVETETA